KSGATTGRRRGGRPAPGPAPPGARARNPRPRCGMSSPSSGGGGRVNRSEESAAALEATIQELAAAIRETDVYRAWQEARAALAQRHAAQVMLRDLQAQQEALLRKAQAGEAITPEDEERLRRTLETVAYDPYVRAVLETDLALAQLLAAVQQALA